MKKVENSGKVYFVLVIENLDGNKVVETWGPFKTIRQCEQRIRDCAVENYTSEAGDFEKGELDDWGSRHIIVESVKTLRAVPSLALHIKLKEV